jgi:hypothetical protein
MFLPIIGLKTPAVVKTLECLKPKTKAVSNRDCVGKKRQVHRKNLIIVSGCYIPLSGETDLAEKQNS